MRNVWRPLPLTEVMTLQRGHDLPSRDRRTGPYPVVAATSIVGYHDQFKVEGPGVVIGRSGSIGGAQWVPGNFWPLNTTLWLKDRKGNDLSFCYYLLKFLDFSHLNVGSGVPTLNRNHLAGEIVLLPPVAEQRAIAAVLGTFDKLIDTNVKLMNDMDELIRAKVGAQVLAGGDLVNPQKLSDVTVMIRRGIAPKYLEGHNDNSVDVVNQRCIRSGKVDLSPSRIAKLPPSLGDRMLRAGDVLVNSTGVGTLGRTAGWSSSREGVTVDGHVTICRADPAITNGNFLRYILRAAEEELIEMSTGSTGQTELGKEQLASLDVSVLPLVDQEWVEPFVHVLDALSDEVSELTSTRDTLLPLLMTGKITSNSAAKLLEEVTK